jgi:hypothetical protein
MLTQTTILLAEGIPEERHVMTKKMKNQKILTMSQSHQSLWDSHTVDLSRNHQNYHRLQSLQVRTNFVKPSVKTIRISLTAIESV